MPYKTPPETPRTLAAGAMTAIAALGMTGWLTAAFTSIGWIGGLYALGRIGQPLMILLFGACAIVLLHHLTHHPAGLIKYLTLAATGLLGIWAVYNGAQATIPLMLGAAIGLAWLRWIHHIGDVRERIKSGRTARIK